MPGQPDNHKRSEHYLSIHVGAWNDVPKSGNYGDFHVAGYICEWKAK